VFESRTSSPRHNVKSTNPPRFNPFNTLSSKFSQQAEHRKSIAIRLSPTNSFFVSFESLSVTRIRNFLPCRRVMSAVNPAKSKCFHLPRGFACQNKSHSRAKPTSPTWRKFHQNPNQSENINETNLQSTELKFFVFVGEAGRGDTERFSILTAPRSEKIEKVPFQVPRQKCVANFD
jgi:hypothetical protein